VAYGLRGEGLGWLIGAERGKCMAASGPISNPRTQRMQGFTQVHYAKKRKHNSQNVRIEPVSILCTKNASFSEQELRFPFP